jgi:TolB protein
VGFDGNDSEIYTINASGGGKRQLTDNDTGDFYPSYSPSGKRIAFVNDAGADREIYTIKPNGEGKHQVIDNITANFNPYWGSQ